MPPNQKAHSLRSTGSQIVKRVVSGMRRIARGVRRRLLAGGYNSPPIPTLSGWAIRSVEEAQTKLPRMMDHYRPYGAFETGLKIGDQVAGYSVPAASMVMFPIATGDGENINFREDLVCPITYIGNRSRATFHKFAYDFLDQKNISVYITEQNTHLFNFMRRILPRLIGSEYLPETPFGSKDTRGIRSEDLTNLTLGDNSQDAILSLDVLEHIPNYQTALSECARVLRPGGRIYITVPFAGSAETLVRAKVIENGEIVHLQEPDYHGDPINGAGILCYYYFGWDILENMKAAGFSDAFAFYYWSKEFGYLGVPQMMIIGVK